MVLIENLIHINIIIIIHIKRLYLRLTECKVTDETNTTEVFAIHSFKDNEVCFDTDRLNVVQTEFFPNAAFNMRTFRFTVRVFQLP